jgi:RNA polymerase sigma factor (sigma-70 family)
MRSRDEFDALARKHYGPVFSLCRSLLGNHHKAEDAVQECFARAFRAFDQYDPSRPFSSWVFKIAQNLCFDWNRPGPLPTALDSEEVRPSDPVSAREDLERIGDAVERLPVVLRLAMMYKYRFGLENSDICRLLEVTPGHLRILLYRAILKVREQL